MKPTLVAWVSVLTLKFLNLICIFLVVNIYIIEENFKLINKQNNIQIYQYCQIEF